MLCHKTQKNFLLLSNFLCTKINNIYAFINLGHMRLRIRFNEALPKDLTVIVLAEFPTHLELSKTGLVKTSYSA